VAPWQIAADMPLETAASEYVVAASDISNLAGVFGSVAGELWMYVVTRRIGVEDVADGTLLVVW
jgi:hypothetical protein